MAKKKTDLPLREFCQLAEKYNPDKSVIAGGLISEKLDGLRMLWDGGATRGMPVGQVPFANITKHARFVNDRFATGLWTRYGQAIYAPDYWLDKLPNFCLDGEVWMGRGMFQATLSIVRTIDENRDDENWDNIKYKIFDTPPISEWMRVGEINDIHFYKVIDSTMAPWLLAQSTAKECRIISPRQFTSQLKFLEKFVVQNDVVQLHQQKQLSFIESVAHHEARVFFNKCVALGAEGAIIRSAIDEWAPKRSKHMLKIKQMNDAECTVIGYTSAEFGETGAKLGLIGALLVDYKGVKFHIGTGYSDQERSFSDEASTRWAKANPGEIAPDRVQSKIFPRGSVITFTYSEFTKDGVPKEARYNRKFAHK